MKTINLALLKLVKRVFASSASGWFKELNAVKVTALITINCFLLTGVYGQTVAAVAENVRSAHEFRQIFEGFALPYSYGKITSAQYNGSDSVIINVQDLHSHPQVQRNISNIIKTFDKEFRVKNVYLEGAYGQVDTSWLAGISDKPLREKVMNALLEDGRLTGAEYFSVESARADIIKGLENKEEYLGNLKRFGEILGYQDDLSAILESIGEDLNALKKTYFNKRQLKIEELSKEYQTGVLDARKYFLLMYKHSDKLGIDMDRYENIRLYAQVLQLGSKIDNSRASKELQMLIIRLKETLPYSAYKVIIDSTNNFNETDRLYTSIVMLSKEGKIDLTVNFPELAKFLHYYELSKRINPLEMIKEEQKFADEISSGFVVTNSEAEVVFLTSFHKYLKDYLSSKITADDYDYYKKNIAEFKKLWVKYVDNKKLSLLENYEKTTDAFYDVNIDRNRYFIKNIDGAKKFEKLEGKSYTGNAADQVIKSMKDAKNVSIVITGGFHTQGVAELLGKEGVSYIVITPNVTGGVELAENKYYQIVKEQSKILFNALATLNISQVVADARIEEVIAALGVKATPENVVNKILEDIIAAEAQKAKKRNEEFTLKAASVAIDGSNIALKVERTDGTNKTIPGIINGDGAVSFNNSAAEDGRKKSIKTSLTSALIASVIGIGLVVAIATLGAIPLLSLPGLLYLIPAYFLGASAYGTVQASQIHRADIAKAELTKSDSETPKFDLLCSIIDDALPEGGRIRTQFARLIFASADVSALKSETARQAISELLEAADDNSALEALGKLLSLSGEDAARDIEDKILNARIIEGAGEVMSFGKDGILRINYNKLAGLIKNKSFLEVIIRHEIRHSEHKDAVGDIASIFEEFRTFMPEIADMTGIAARNIFAGIKNWFAALRASAPQAKKEDKASEAQLPEAQEKAQAPEAQEKPQTSEAQEKAQASEVQEKALAPEAQEKPAYIPENKDVVKAISSSAQMNGLLIRAFNAYNKARIDDFNENSEFTLRQQTLPKLLLRFKEIIQLGMGKGKQGGIQLAALQFLADRAGKSSKDRIIVTTKGGDLALRDAEALAGLVSSPEMKEFMTGKDGLNLGDSGIFKIGVFNQDGTYSVIEVNVKTGAQTITSPANFKEFQNKTAGGVIFGTPQGLNSLLISHQIDNASANWHIIMDEADSALVQGGMTPLIISGKTPKKDAQLNIDIAIIADRAAKVLKDKKGIYEVNGNSVSLLPAFIARDSVVENGVSVNLYEEAKNKLKENGIEIVAGSVPAGLSNKMSEEEFLFRYRQAVQSALRANLKALAGKSGRYVTVNGVLMLADENTGEALPGQEESFESVAIAIANGMEPGLQTVVEDQISLFYTLRYLCGDNLERFTGTSGTAIDKEDYIKQSTGKDVLNLDTDSIGGANAGSLLFADKKAKNEALGKLAAALHDKKVAGDDKDNVYPVAMLIRENSREAANEAAAAIVSADSKRSLLSTWQLQNALSSYELYLKDKKAAEKRGETLPYSFNHGTLSSNAVIIVDADLKEKLGDNLRGLIQEYILAGAVVIHTNVFATGYSFEGVMFGIGDGITSEITRVQNSGRPARGKYLGWYANFYTVEEFRNLNHDRTNFIVDMLAGAAVESFDYAVPESLDAQADKKVAAALGEKAKRYKGDAAAIIEPFISNSANLEHNPALKKHLLQLREIEAIKESEDTAAAVRMATGDRVSYARENVENHIALRERTNSGAAGFFQEKYGKETLDANDYINTAKAAGTKIDVNDRVALEAEGRKIIFDEYNNWLYAWQIESFGKILSNKDYVKLGRASVDISESSAEALKEETADAEVSEKETIEDKRKAEESAAEALGRKIVDSKRKAEIEALKRVKIEIINESSQYEHNEGIIGSNKWIQWLIQKSGINVREMIAKHFYSAEKEKIDSAINDSSADGYDKKLFKSVSLSWYGKINRKSLIKAVTNLFHGGFRAFLSFAGFIGPLLPLFGLGAIMAFSSLAVGTGVISLAALAGTLLPLVALIGVLYFGKKKFLDPLMSFQSKKNYDIANIIYMFKPNMSNAVKAARGKFNILAVGLVSFALITSVGFAVVGLFATATVGAALLMAGFYIALGGAAVLGITLLVNRKDLKSIFKENTTNEKVKYSGVLAGAVASFLLAGAVKLAVLYAASALAVAGIIAAALVLLAGFLYFYYKGKTHLTGTLKETLGWGSVGAAGMAGAAIALWKVAGVLGLANPAMGVIIGIVALVFGIGIYVWGKTRSVVDAKLSFTSKAATVAKKLFSNPLILSSLIPFTLGAVAFVVLNVAVLPYIIAGLFVMSVFLFRKQIKTRIAYKSRVMSPFVKERISDLLGQRETLLKDMSEAGEEKKEEIRKHIEREIKFIEMAGALNSVTSRLSGLFDLSVPLSKEQEDAVVKNIFDDLASFRQKIKFTFGQSLESLRNKENLILTADKIGEAIRTYHEALSEFSNIEKGVSSEKMKEWKEKIEAEKKRIEDAINAINISKVKDALLSILNSKDKSYAEGRPEILKLAEKYGAKAKIRSAGGIVVVDDAVMEAIKKGGEKASEILKNLGLKKGDKVISSSGYKSLQSNMTAEKERDLEAQIVYNDSVDRGLGKFTLLMQRLFGRILSNKNFFKIVTGWFVAASSFAMTACRMESSQQQAVREEILNQLKDMGITEEQIRDPQKLLPYIARIESKDGSVVTVAENEKGDLVAESQIDLSAPPELRALLQAGQRGTYTKT
jgi:hypothetical protein